MHTACLPVSNYSIKGTPANAHSCGWHAEYISLLFTDLGVLTPAAVSDELIQLYV